MSATRFNGQEEDALRREKVTRREDGNKIYEEALLNRDENGTEMLDILIGELENMDSLTEIEGMSETGIGIRNRRS